MLSDEWQFPIATMEFSFMNNHGYSSNIHQCPHCGFLLSHTPAQQVRISSFMLLFGVGTFVCYRLYSKTIGRSVKRKTAQLEEKNPENMGERTENLKEEQLIGSNQHASSNHQEFKTPLKCDFDAFASPLPINKIKQPLYFTTPETEVSFNLMNSSTRLQGQQAPSLNGLNWSALSEIHRELIDSQGPDSLMLSNLSIESENNFSSMPTFSSLPENSSFLISMIEDQSGDSIGRLLDQLKMDQLKLTCENSEPASLNLNVMAEDTATLEWDSTDVVFFHEDEEDIDSMLIKPIPFSEGSFYNQKSLEEYARFFEDAEKSQNSLRFANDLEQQFSPKKNRKLGELSCLNEKHENSSVCSSLVSSVCSSTEQQDRSLENLIEKAKELGLVKDLLDKLIKQTESDLEGPCAA